ncbi:MAG: ribonuclease J [Candidatus Spechtbacteria bacterium]|nr:ribonuclease J [Candidatus Spechtbacteria bacterium]
MAGSRVYIDPRGGLQNVGERNCYAIVFEHDGIKEAILLDCGQKIPSGESDRDNLGPEYFPNFDDLIKQGIRVRAIFISHGHIDHVGGVKWFLENYSSLCSDDFRVYGSAFTLGVLRKIVYKYDEPQSPLWKFVTLQTGTVVRKGLFSAQMFPVNHSIPGAMGIHVSVAGKNILYLGDWKRRGPGDSEAVFMDKMERYGVDGVDALLLDSTNADEDGATLSEEVATSAIIETINRHNNARVLIATFSSHMHRITAIVEAARRANRPVFLAGRSLINYSYIAQLQGVHFFRRDINDDYYPLLPSNAVILCTGVQAEPHSFLPRMLAGEIYGMAWNKERDVVIIAASTIPKEDILARVPKMIGELSKIVQTIYLARDVVTDEEPENAIRGMYHVSGHGMRDDSAAVLKVVRPRLLIPVHGDAQRRALMQSLAPHGTTTVLASERQEVEI